MARYIHAGKTIDHTPPVDIAAGTVVLMQDMVGVANFDIAANTLGALTIEGVFDFPKEAGIGKMIAPGSSLFWDHSMQVATTDMDSGNNKYLGKSVASASEDDTVVRLKLLA